MESASGQVLFPVEQRVPGREISERITRLQRAIVLAGADAFLVTYKIDLLYFAGTAQNGVLYVPSKGSSSLFVRKHLSRAESESSIAQIKGIASIKELPSRVEQEYGALPQVLGTAWDVMPAREFLFIKELFSARVHVDASPMIHRVRSIKSGWEKKQIRKASSIAEETLQHLETKTYPGMSATHAEGVAEAFARRLGHGGGIRVRHPCQDPHSVRIGCGTLPCPRIPAKGSPLTLGFRASVNGYHAEEARPVSSAGTWRFGDEESLFLEFLEACVARTMRAGAPIMEPARTAKEGLALYRKALPPASLIFNCRGIGLELWEPPFLQLQPYAVLEEGMCLSVEVGLLGDRGDCVSRTGTYE
ncbi:MAG: M24 family metallopeptidase, partial [Desulfobacteraceae bacterium]